MVRVAHGDNPLHEQDEEPDNPGFYYPVSYVLMTWHEKNEHGILPEPGGLNDQDWRLVEHDWPLVTQTYNRLSRELYPVSESPSGRNIRLPMSDGAGDFDDLVKEG